MTVKKSYTVDQVAKDYDVSRKTIEREIQRGELDAIRVGRSLRVTSDALSEYERKKKVDTDGLR